MEANRIDRTFGALAKSGKRAFMPFITAGDPDLETTAEAFAALDRAGADIVELGIPFSDPVADGPVIQASYTRALGAGLHVDDIFAATREIRRSFTKPIVYMVSFSIVYRRGLESFAAGAAEAGADGLIVPDLPVEESGALADAARKNGLHMIYLIAPTTTEARRREILRRASGFLYYMAVSGVTGERQSVAAELAGGVASVKAETRVPVCVGFGVSRPEQALEIARYADGVIVGSALVKVLAAAGLKGKAAALAELERAAGELARATKSV